MVRYAAETLVPCGKNGAPEPGRRIDIGDRCLIGARAGLWPVTYPASGGTRNAFLADISGTAAVYNQNDYADVPYPAAGYEAATLKSGGCGPTCMAMIVETLRPYVSFDPAAAAAFSRAAGARVSGGTDMGLLSRRVGEKFGLRVRGTNLISELLAHLKNGGAAVANTAGRGMFSTGGHYIVVLSEEGGLLTIADPGFYGGKYGVRYPKRKAAVRVCGKLLRASPEVLDADCVGRTPRYYLFR